jgi:hypothetical protein
MSELPIQTNSHIFTNKNGNTLMREFVGIFSKSRHLYDLAQSMSTDIAIRAIINNELWNIAHHHRDLFTSMSEVDYTPDIRRRIKLLPPDEIIDDWRNDYKDMQSSMIYGEKPSFEVLIAKIKELENNFMNIIQ